MCPRTSPPTRTATASPTTSPYSQRNREIGGAQSARLEDREQERREQDGRSERDRLHPGRIRRTGEHEEEDHPERGGSFEHDDEHEHDEQEQRVERVLRHDRSRVRERRDRNGEHRCEERQTVPRHTPREEERGHRGEGHEERVLRFDRRVRVGQAVEQRVGGADQKRVDDAVPGIGLIAKQRLAGVGDSARELGPDDLVDEDERGDDPANEDRASEHGAGDDRGEPRPGGDSA